MKLPRLIYCLYSVRTCIVYCIYDMIIINLHPLQNVIVFACTMKCKRYTSLFEYNTACSIV